MIVVVIWPQWWPHPNPVLPTPTTDPSSFSWWGWSWSCSWWSWQCLWLCWSWLWWSTATEKQLISLLEWSSFRQKWPISRKQKWHFQCLKLLSAIYIWHTPQKMNWPLCGFFGHSSSLSGITCQMYVRLKRIPCNLWVYNYMDWQVNEWFLAKFWGGMDCW